MGDVLKFGLIALLFALLGAFLYFVGAPAWLYFLHMESWSLAWGIGGLILLLPLLGAINVPLFSLGRQTRLAVNALGVLTPVGLIAWRFTADPPPWTWTLALPALALGVAYLALSRVGEKGVELPAISLWIGALLAVIAHTLLDDLSLRHLMLCAFTSQFASLAFMDVARVAIDHDRLIGRFDSLSFGGAGAQDALWSGPSAALYFAWIAQWIFWGGLDALP